jgi:KDO2-lipid IV(A) lauroyltransferase
LGDRIVYYLLKIFISLAGLLPRSWIYASIKAVTLAFYHMSKRRREITKDNLKKAFPGKGQDEIDRLSREVYISLSETISEILFMLADRFDIDDAVINKEEALDKLKMLEEEGTLGRIVMTAHFSNWELAAHFLAKHGYPMLAVGRKGDNQKIDQQLTLPFREKYGNRSVYKKRAAIAIMKTLKRGEIVGVLIDQKVSSADGVKVRFFGREVYTTSIVATMKQKLNVMVVPIFLPRVERGKYKLIVGDPIKEKSDIVTMTQCYNDAIEEVVRAYPEQWFWMHNRWKV